MNPLQLGGIKRKDLLYPPLTKKDSFAGCLRNVYDNGIMYDLSKSIEERDIGSECPFFAKCPTCYHGYCRTTFVPFVCICDFGWTGPLCNERKNIVFLLHRSPVLPCLGCIDLFSTSNWRVMFANLQSFRPGLENFNCWALNHPPHCPLVTVNIEMGNSLPIRGEQLIAHHKWLKMALKWRRAITSLKWPALEISCFWAKHQGHRSITEQPNIFTTFAQRT